MAGTRTAPAATLEANFVTVTLHVIDASGDTWTQMLPISGARTAIEIEAWVAAYQAATNASVWKITQTNCWEGAKDASNGVAAYRATIASGINMLYKDVATGASISERLVAPIVEVMQGNQDIPLLSAAEMTALILATIVLIPAYTHQQAQFTGRTERTNNPVINA